MTIRLIKNHQLGKAGQIIDVSDERANYLMRIKAAEPVFEKVEVGNMKEKKEFSIQGEKKVHSGLPVEKKKRGRKPKAG